MEQAFYPFSPFVSGTKTADRVLSYGTTARTSTPQDAVLARPSGGDAPLGAGGAQGVGVTHCGGQHTGPAGAAHAPRVREENLALLDPKTRALVLICRDEGLRISEALILKTDCLKKTPSGHWALVPYKSKDKSFRAIPASRAVVDAVREQHGRVRERFGDACRWLFPKVSGNPDGKYPMPYGILAALLWLLPVLLALTPSARTRIGIMGT
ncbi:hypothetical protein GCM10020367_55270 [Streptomyces sannanensis]|uniref:Tyr recombinase domain-containing protein n=1 Tax=Streptomyces sannanensis TaxID=285536 RepID=A0ABP6SJ76_9ACTN